MTESANAKQSLEGAEPALDREEEKVRALDQALDYRGDVTITLDDGRKVDGYIFDRRREQGEPLVRVMPVDSDEAVKVPYARIVGLKFSDRDPAAGKSFETWIKKYIEKKSRGEEASIESEPLE